MNPITLTAHMRETLMRAYLLIQVGEGLEKLSIDYAAKISAMPDTELVEHLTESSSLGIGPHRIAQAALQYWRMAK